MVIGNRKKPAWQPPRIKPSHQASREGPLPYTRFDCLLDGADSDAWPERERAVSFSGGGNSAMPASLCFPMLLAGAPGFQFERVIVCCRCDRMTLREFLTCHPHQKTPGQSQPGFTIWRWRLPLDYYYTAMPRIFCIAPRQGQFNYATGVDSTTFAARVSRRPVVKDRGITCQEYAKAPRCEAREDPGDPAATVHFDKKHKGRAKNSPTGRGGLRPLRVLTSSW